jgi:hypothetical protein
MGDESGMHDIIQLSFDRIEVKFRLLRREKIEPELVIDIIIFKGVDSYPIEIFNKSSLTDKEKEIFQTMEDKRNQILKKFKNNLTNNKKMWIKFITNVEEVIFLFYRTIEVVSFTYEELNNFIANSTREKFIEVYFQNAYNNLVKNAKSSGEK